ncbi:hypothetical protein R50072_31280 [Simiduia litorea]|uniref:DUF799 domain-containing protein n=1 Tax=Simiduia litorea TaxID=1435348 RepID=UPI0036F19C3E
MRIKTTVIITLIGLLLTACASQKKVEYDWSGFNAANPRSILILPVLNNTVDVDAPLFALSTLSVPLGNKGYYVFPVNTVKTVLEQEGLYDGETIKQLGSESLANMFGADSVLYVEINKWDAQYMLLSTTVTVSIDYTLDDKLGNQIWSEQVTTMYTPNNNSTGNPMADLVAAAITAGITRAAPNYIPLMQQANHIAFNSGAKAIPQGPYAPKKTK